MKFRTLFALSSALIFGGAGAAQALSTVASTDANALTNLILGPGISVVGTPTLTSGPFSAGSFSDGAASGIGIDTGLILTTGSVNQAPGPNSADGLGTNFGPGDADLTAIVGTNTNDATVLEFDFTTAGGDLFFNYVFASEEYNEFANSQFNDVFAFFLDGTNIALIPGTSTPVEINTVNGGDPFGTGAVNPQFFNNNDLQDGGPFFDIEYDGFTDVFQAQALGLAAGTHSIKLAIADTSDSGWDSAVFIQGGSFADIPDAGEPPPPPMDDDPPPPTNGVIPEPGTALLLGFGLTVLAARRRNA